MLKTGDAAVAVGATATGLATGVAFGACAAGATGATGAGDAALTGGFFAVGAGWFGVAPCCEGMPGQRSGESLDMDDFMVGGYHGLVGMALSARKKRWESAYYKKFYTESVRREYMAPGIYCSRLRTQKTGDAPAHPAILPGGRMPPI